MAFDTSQELFWAGNEYVRLQIASQTNAYVTIGPSQLILRR